MGPFPTDHLSAAPPADWRERLLRALASEGVTEPPYVPVWRLTVMNLGTAILWLLLGGLPVLVLVVAGQFLPEQVLETTPGSIVILVWLIGYPIFVFIYILPRVQKAARQYRAQLAGRNPTRAVMKARRAPIFYLRSFAFDQAASAPPKWLQRAVTLVAGAVAIPTPELTLILRLRRYAPVLAIGRPGEFDPPPGAMRFYVTNERWEATVESILPCCQLVVWVSGNTRGLRWEIEHLIKRLPPQRLLLWPHVHVGNLKRRRRAAEWQRFVESHRDVFPKPLPPDIKSIRFIAFDADWTPIQIPSARYPTTILDRLAYFRWSLLGLSSFLKERFR
jgi:hypothetical protein